MAFAETLHGGNGRVDILSRPIVVHKELVNACGNPAAVVAVNGILIAEIAAVGD